MFNVPVLLVIYNRIEETHNLFQIVRTLAPKFLYVAADGHNPSEKLDYERCLRTRCVIKPEWSCEQKNLFCEEHLGKSRMIYKAISWFFENEEEGIVLFDDNLPHIEFFLFCEQLLEKYRNTPEVMHISGNNFQKKNKNNKHSYYFSAYPFTWGFATWKRTWQNFDLSMDEFEDIDFQEVISVYMDNQKKARKKWTRIFNILKKHRLDYWEYQYAFHIWLQEGLCITPNVNLVKNVGFKYAKRKIRRLIKKAKPILPLQHPARVRQDKDKDRYTFRKVYKRAFFRVWRSWIGKILGENIKL